MNSRHALRWFRFQNVIYSLTFPSYTKVTDFLGKSPTILLVAKRLYRIHIHKGATERLKALSIINIIRNEAPKVDLQRVGKRFLVIFLPLAALLAGILVVLYSIEVKNERTVFETKESHRVDLQVETINGELKSIVTDLKVLSTHHELQTMLESGSASHQKALAEEFLSFSENKRLYDQVRFLDETGMEVIRVNFNDGRPSIVPREQLQFKGKRYYFKDTFRLERGEVFVSPFDLNIEQGKIEQPLKPMIRFGTPVVDSQGRKRGVVILNYLGANLLSNLDRISASAPGQFMLLNSDGFWLKGPRPENEWGFMYKDGSSRTFGNSRPDVWQKILVAESGQFHTDEGMFTFETVYPLLEGQKSSTGSGEAFEPSTHKLGAKKYYWKVVSQVSPGVLYTVSGKLLGRFFQLYAAAVVLLAIASSLIAHASEKRKHAEEALRDAHIESERTKEYLETLIEGSLDAIITTDKEGNIVLFNEGAEFLLGYKSEEVVGRRASMLFEGEEWAKDVMRQMRQSGGKVAGFETILRAKDGTLVPVMISSSILYDDEGQEAGTVGFNKDLRERVLAEEALRQAEEKYRNIFEHAIEGIFQTTSDGLYISANPALARIYGYESPEELKNNLTDINQQLYVDPNRRTEFTRLIKEHNAVTAFESQIYRKDGSVIWISENARVVRNPSGELLYYEGTVENITDRKRAEELMRLAQERMQQQLEIAQTIQQSFLPAYLPGDDDPRYSLAAINTPAVVVGGDYYDVIPLGHDRLGLVICDVSGKGIPGAIYMARLVSDFRFLVDPHEGTPAGTLTELNRILEERGPPGMFVTVLYLILNVSTGVVTFANAGHLPVLVRRAQGTVEEVEGAAGPPLSILKDIIYTDAEIILAPNEDLLLFTDGVTEAMNSTREQFTHERLVEVLQNAPVRPEALIDAVVEAVKAFSGDVPAHDDLTLLAARWEGEDPLAL